MKLIFCPQCLDMFKLALKEVKRCDCGLIAGKYKSDGDNAIVNRHAIVFAIANPDIAHATERPDHPVVRCWRSVDSPKIEIADGL